MDQLHLLTLICKAPISDSDYHKDPELAKE